MTVVAVRLDMDWLPFVDVLGFSGPGR
jgi:hypothetical protein